MGWMGNVLEVDLQLAQVGGGVLNHPVDNGAPRQAYQRASNPVHVHLPTAGAVQLRYEHRDVRLRIEQVQ